MDQWLHCGFNNTCGMTVAPSEGTLRESPATITLQEKDWCFPTFICIKTIVYDSN